MSSMKLPESKLPHEQESIFATMSKMAAKHKAVDLSQGFPDFETDKRLKDLVHKAMLEGYNQYAPLAGVRELREEIAAKIENLHSYSYDPESEITVTNGATQALNAAITAFVHNGDEVIVFKPAYDSYEPTIKVNAGIPVPVQLQADFSIDWEELSSKMTSKTRMIILNTPHNPSGTVLSKNDLEQLEKVLQDTDVLLLSDEVYEHIIFDDNIHHSASSLPRLAKRSIVCASFGKTFHNTGWKMGYCAAPKELMQEIHKIHGITVFCVNHPLQRAFAEYLKDPEHYLQLRSFYQEKRDRFLALIKDSGFRGEPSGGTYFQLMDYSEITDEPDVEFAERLVKEYGLAAIPVSVFNLNNEDNRQLRFCFAKKDETLQKAAEIINRIGNRK